jgi:hypothetical protein
VLSKDVKKGKTLQRGIKMWIKKAKQRNSVAALKKQSKA